MQQRRFSRRTFIAAIELLEKTEFNQAALTRYVLKLGPSYDEAVGGEGLSLPKRLNNLIRFADKNPDAETDDGELLQDVLVESAVAAVLKARSPWGEFAEDFVNPKFEPIIRSLEIDGFVIKDESIRRILPVDIGLPDAESELSLQLNKHSLSVPKGHLDQALNAYSQGDWAAANGQLRTFFDALLDEIAVRLDPEAAEIPSGQGRRAKLAASGFLSRELNEWNDTGAGFINGLIKRMHPHGAHPGLSDEEDSAFRLHVVLLTARLLLARYDRRVT